MKLIDPTRYHSEHPLSHALALMRLIQRMHSTKYFSVADASLELRAMQRNRDLELLFFCQPSISFTIDWDALMASKTNKPAFNLIDYRLTDSELESYENAVSKEAPNFLKLLAAFAEKDYKVSFTFVENSEAWCVSVTGKQDAKFNSESTLTTWSDDPLDGLAMAAYKVFTVFGGGVWKTKTQSRRG